MSDDSKKWFKLNLNSKHKQPSSSGGCGCGKTSGGCNSHKKEELNEEEFFEAAVDASIGDERKKDGFDQVFDRTGSTLVNP